MAGWLRKIKIQCVPSILIIRNVYHFPTKVILFPFSTMTTESHPYLSIPQDINVPRPGADLELFDELICYTDDSLGIIPPSPQGANTLSISNTSKSKDSKPRRSKKSKSSKKSSVGARSLNQASSTSPSPIPPQFSHFIKRLSTPVPHEISGDGIYAPNGRISGASISGLSKSLEHHTPIPDSSTENVQPRRKSSTVLLRPISRQKSLPKRQLLGGSANSLSRQNAVREKKGGKFYRIKLRIKRMMQRAKEWRFYRFTVLRKGIHRRKSSYKKRSASLVISAPQTNPTLGAGNARHVTTLSTELKALAGGFPVAGPLAEVSDRPHISSRRASQMRMASYISDQQSRYVSDMFTKTQNSSVEYPLSRGIEQQLDPTPNTSLGYGDAATMFTNLWRQYLALVLSQRIKLRMEIESYNKFMQARQTNFIGQVDDDLLSCSTASHVNETASKSLEPLQYATLDEFVEVPDQEFEDTFENRKSMLGEMLEYNSDGYLTHSSTSETLNALVSSLVYLFSQRYATRSKRSCSVVDLATTPALDGSFIPRLKPITYNLNEAVA